MKYQRIKVKDYGDGWINRLAVILNALEQMGPGERDATLTYVVKKYQ